MKKTILKKTGFAMLLIGVISFSGQAKSQEKKGSQLAPFYHNCEGIKDLKAEQIICKPDESGKYLTLHRKYNFAYDDENRVVKKEACIWNQRSQKWIPAYILTFSYDMNRMETYYAKWDKRKGKYDTTKEKIVYKTCHLGVTAYTSYKRNSLDSEWEVVTDLPDIYPNRFIVER